MDRYLNEFGLLVDLFFNVLILDVVVGLFLEDVVLVSEDLDLGFDLLYSFLVVLTSFLSLTDKVVCEVIVLHFNSYSEVDLKSSC